MKWKRNLTWIDIRQLLIATHDFSKATDQRRMELTKEKWSAITHLKGPTEFFQKKKSINKKHQNLPFYTSTEIFCRIPKKRIWKREILKKARHVSVWLVNDDHLGRETREQQRRRQLWKRAFKKWIRAASNFMALIPSRLIFQTLAIFFEFNSKGLHQSSGKEKESGCLVFPSSTKREFRQQWRQRNVQMSVMHVQSCCFANLSLLRFCRSRCRHRCRCLSSLPFLPENSLPDRS